MTNDRAKIATDAMRDRVVARAKRLIEISLKHRFSVTELASVLEVSPRTLRDLIKDRCGCSPSAYVNTLRIVEAKRLLDQGLPIKQVASSVGFFDQSHLTRHFKRRVGESPAEYVAKRHKHQPSIGAPPEKSDHALDK
jgi:transcriptional regulator GlxA family with amidase domain